jgi:hypothetical protein
VPRDQLSGFKTPLVRDATGLPGGTAILPLSRPNEERIAFDVAFAGPEIDAFNTERDYGAATHQRSFT